MSGDEATVHMYMYVTNYLLQACDGVDADAKRWTVTVWRVFSFIIIPL